MATAADKFADAVKIDPMNVLTVSRRRQAVEDQTKENRRMHYAVSEVCRVICMQNATAENLHKWASSLLGYAKLHQQDAVKHAELHRDAGRKIQQALAINLEFLDSKVQEALARQGGELEFMLRLLLDCPALKSRVKSFGSAVSTISLSGCAALTDVMLSTLADVCPGIRSIDISTSRRISDEGVQYLAAAVGPNLVAFYANGCDNITDASIVSLSQNGSRLETISLAGCTGISDHSLDLLLRCFPGMGSSCRLDDLLMKSFSSYFLGC